MIIDHPYIKSAKIVTSYDDASYQKNTLIVETTVEMAKECGANDTQAHELLELIAQLRSFAEHDFADFEDIQILNDPRVFAGLNAANTNTLNSMI